MNKKQLLQKIESLKHDYELLSLEGHLDEFDAGFEASTQSIILDLEEIILEAKA